VAAVAARRLGVLLGVLAAGRLGALGTVLAAVLAAVVALG
jgi:hypothetical protein